MLVTGVHSSKENPPQVPMITAGYYSTSAGITKEGFDIQESIVSMAAAVIKAVMQNSPTPLLFNHPKFNRRSMKAKHHKVVAITNRN